MTAKFQAVDPGKTQFSLTLTMPLDEWIALAEHLKGERWPAWEVSRAIDNMVTKSRAVWHDSVDPLKP